MCSQARLCRAAGSGGGIIERRIQLLRNALDPQPRPTGWEGLAVPCECARCACLGHGSLSLRACVSLCPALLTRCRD